MDIFSNCESLEKTERDSLKFSRDNFIKTKELIDNKRNLIFISLFIGSKFIFFPIQRSLKFKFFPMSFWPSYFAISILIPLTLTIPIARIAFSKQYLELKRPVFEFQKKLKNNNYHEAIERDLTEPDFREE